MAKKVIELPFIRGQDEGIDAKLLAEVAPKGTLARAVNVRLRKDGRLGMRRDYTSLSMTSTAGTLVATDVVNFDGRLVAFGDSLGRNYPSDIYELTSSATSWVGSEADGDRRLSFATKLRDMGRLPATGVTCVACDVAAANGIVCMVSSDATQSFVTVFRADFGQKILVERSTTALFFPRVVAIGNVFFIAGINSTGTAIDLRKFDPTSDVATVALSTPFAAGAAIVQWDMTANTAQTELVMGVARVTPTTQLLRVNTAGATQQTIAGPATLLDFITVWNDGTRISMLDVPDATKIVRLSTYLVAGGALENGPTTMFGGGTTVMQASFIQRFSTSISCIAQLDANNFTVAYQDVTTATHALGTNITIWRASKVSTKGFGLIDQSSPNNTQRMVGGQFISPDLSNVLVNLPNGPLATTDHYFGGTSLVQLPHLAQDATSGKYYWPKLTQDTDGISTPVVTEFSAATSERNQTASIGGHLYTALGATDVYDGREAVESGFLDTPVIISATSSNGAGTLTPGALYTVTVIWEKLDALGHLHTSSPAVVSQVLMGGADDTISVVVTTPHSVRRNTTHSNFAATVQAVAYCTIANGDQLQRALTVSTGSSTLGGTVTMVILGPDATLATAEVLYTQGARGALSGPLPFECPLPARYIWASKERLLVGGQPYGPQIQESRPLFPNEPIQWSLGLGFFATVRGETTAVAILDENRFVFTRDEVFVVPGEGIDDNGNGVLGPALKVPSECGCIDWRSLCEIGDGLLFQGDTDKIYILPRSGGAPQWIGQPIRDTLAAFPVIVSASFCHADQTVCFTCNNTGATDGRILVYDTRAQTWYVDEPLAAETYRSSCSVGGLLYYINGPGTVRQQQSTEAPSTFIPMTLETGDIFPAGTDGWAQIYGCSVLCEFRGNFTLTLQYSTDNGKNFTTGLVYTLSGLAVGTRVRRTWTLGPFQAESIRLRFTATALAGAATAGCTFHSYGIFAEPVEGLARLPADSQG